MDGYEQIWTLFGQGIFSFLFLFTIILLGWRFIYFTRLLGRNIAKVLATLVAMMYSNLLFAIFVTFHPAILHISTNGTQYSKVVLVLWWKYTLSRPRTCSTVFHSTDMLTAHIRTLPHKFTSFHSVSPKEIWIFVPSLGGETKAILWNLLWTLLWPLSLLAWISTLSTNGTIHHGFFDTFTHWYILSNKNAHHISIFCTYHISGLHFFTRSLQKVAY